MKTNQMQEKRLQTNSRENKFSLKYFFSKNKRKQTKKVLKIIYSTSLYLYKRKYF